MQIDQNLKSIKQNANRSKSKIDQTKCKSIKQNAHGPHTGPLTMMEKHTGGAQMEKTQQNITESNLWYNWLK